jgi:diguanylate cyclase
MRRAAKGIAHAIHALTSWLKALRQGNGSFCQEYAQVNLNRIIYCALVAIPVNVVHIIIYSLRVTGSAAEARWRMGIILSHMVLMVLMACFGLAAWKLRHSGNGRCARILQLTIAATLLAMGVVITEIDQLVTTNITPYILCCVMVGALFLLRPFVSALLFAASFVVFLIMIDPGKNTAAFLSNRTNGMSAMAIGFGLSLAVWRHFTVEYRQRRQIEAQSEELERINRELQNMAFTDSLTGLPNRRYFDQAVARELAAIERGRQPAGVIEFDLDFFKEINDTCGHAAGDEVLRQIAKLVNDTIRKADMFARYGGEEFILLLPGTSLEGARLAAEKLKKQIEAQVFLVDGHKIRLTASFGVTELKSNPAINCYRWVDRALYRAKQRGRNRVEVMQQDDPGEMNPEAEIPDAPPTDAPPTDALLATDAAQNITVSVAG